MRRPLVAAQGVALLALVAGSATVTSVGASAAAHRTGASSSLDGPRRLSIAQSEKPGVIQQRPSGVSRYANRSLSPASGPSFGGAWSELGPRGIANDQQAQTAAGRITGVAPDPSHPGTIYIASAGGGVWKTTNGGAHWAPLTDDQGSLGMGAIAVDAAGVVYAGEGELNGPPRQDQPAGNGVLKSTDGGATWTLENQNSGGTPVLANSSIGSIAVDSTTSGSTEHVFAATNLGLFESVDAGAHWSPVSIAPTPLPGGGGTSGGVMQIVQDPSNPSTWWLAVSDFGFSEAGDIMVSTNGGTSFSSVLNFANPGGAPFKTGAGRVAIGVGTSGTAYYAAADTSGPGDLLAMGQLTGYGATNNAVNLAGSPPGFENFVFPAGYPAAQGGYDLVVAVDPSNNNDVIYGGVYVMGTTTGNAGFVDLGANSSTPNTLHTDFHAFASSAGTLYVGNDGGLFSTSDWGGAANTTPGQPSDWNDLDGDLGITQYYGGAALDTTHILGGSQDNGSSGSFAGVTPMPALPAWTGYFAGDGVGGLIDPSSGSNVIYAGTPSGNINRGTTANAPSPMGLAGAPYTSFVTAAPCDGSTSTAACNERSGFVFPYVMDPANPQHLLTGYQNLYESTSGGLPAGVGGWNNIAGPLTDGAASDFIASISFVAGHAGTYFTTSNEGAVWTNVSGAWQNITGNLPPFSPAVFDFPIAYTSGVAVNPSNPDEAWVTIAGIGVDNVWHTLNANAGASTTWTDVSGAPGTGVNTSVGISIQVDPNDPSVIYVGTRYGVYICATCGGASPSASWSRLGSGLPNVPVFALSVTADGHHLVAWTYGRGAWALPMTAGPPPPGGGVYTPVTPFRILDTRAGSQVNCPGGCTLGQGGTHTVQVAGVGGIPSSATAAVINLTGIQPAAGTYLSVAPSGSSTIASSSTLNLTPGAIQANLVTVALSGSGAVDVYNAQGSTDAAMDVEGYFTPSAATPPPAGTAGTFHAVAPTRVCDTRGSATSVCTVGALGAGQSEAISVGGPVPSGGVAAAAVFNLTAVQPTQGTYLTASPPNPDGSCNPQTTTSSINLDGGDILPNRVIVPIGQSGAATDLVCIYNSAGSVNFIIDVNGWFGTASDPTAGALFYPVNPQRICDTRGGNATQCSGRSIGQGQALTVNAVGTASGDPPSPVAIVVNTTGILGTSGTFVSLYPHAMQPSPLTSDLNLGSGQIIANLVIVSLNSGQLDVYNNVGTIDAALDAEGWFQ